MPMHAIPETAALPHLDPRYVTTVPVRVIADDGTTATVQIEGCGIHLRQGAVHDVPSSTVERR
ncbi:MULTISPECIES: hypothetical protein [Streptomyces]|uniref:hypothetical protein n=1 Tax=Streptomyces TaxID=1883 RepID=UPI002E0E3463|nr:hypothetical protein OG483_22875 [[Kitasatospora] papulosa]